jgi:hypothetical protein
MPLPHDLFARGYVLQPFDTECRKVPQNGELIHVGEWPVLSMSFPLIVFDLLLQLFPPANFIFHFWLGPCGVKHIVDIILLAL